MSKVVKMNRHKSYRCSGLQTTRAQRERQLKYPQQVNKDRCNKDNKNRGGKEQGQEEQSQTNTHKGERE